MSSENLAVSQPTQATPSLHPGFFKALRGVWLLTWRSQLTWRRFAGALVGLLALPVVIYLTTPSPKAWAQSHGLQLGHPAVILSGFNRRAVRSVGALKPEQRAELGRILREEYQRAETDWAQNATAEPSGERQYEAIEACQGRILQRARPVLDEKQFTEFQKYLQRQNRQPTAPADGMVWGRTTGFYRFLIDLYFFIVLPLNCVRMCGPLIRDELDADTLSFLVTRPVTRAQLLLTKFLSQMTWLQIGLLLQTLVVFLAAYLRQVPQLTNLLPVFLGTQLLAVLAWSALGLFLGQLSKRYMALALLYGAIVEMGIGRIPTNINNLSMMRHLQTLLAHDPTLQNVFNWSAGNVSNALSALIFGAAVFLALAAVLFSTFEYHRTAQTESSSVLL